MQKLLLCLVMLWSFNSGEFILRITYTLHVACMDYMDLDVRCSQKGR